MENTFKIESPSILNFQIFFHQTPGSGWTRKTRSGPGFDEYRSKTLDGNLNTYTENRVSDPDQQNTHYFVKLDPDLDALERKAGSGSALQSKFRGFRGSILTLTMEAYSLQLEP
jgi:hypothetical protein